MGFFKKKLKPDEVLDEVERILKEPKHRISKEGKSKCPKCLSSNISKVVGWKESTSGYSALEKWRGKDLVPYHCRNCGNEFFI